ERGFTLEGAKTHLREERQKTLSNFEIIQKLERIRSELIKIKSQL
ncbi:MAG: transcriptional regulator, partial [Eudoraea sp.]